jgi:hypothetical protein
MNSGIYVYVLSHIRVTLDCFGLHIGFIDHLYTHNLWLHFTDHCYTQTSVLSLLVSTSQFLVILTQ